LLVQIPVERRAGMKTNGKPRNRAALQIAFSVYGFVFDLSAATSNGIAKLL